MSQQSFVVEGRVVGPNGDGVHGLVVDDHCAI